MWPSFVRARLLYRSVQQTILPIDTFVQQQRHNNNNSDKLQSCHVTSVHYRSLFAMLQLLSVKRIPFHYLSDYLDGLGSPLENQERIICIRMFDDKGALVHDFCVHISYAKNEEFEIGRGKNLSMYYIVSSSYKPRLSFTEFIQGRDNLPAWTNGQPNHIDHDRFIDIMKNRPLSINTGPWIQPVICEMIIYNNWPISHQYLNLDFESEEDANVSSRTCQILIHAQILLSLRFQIHARMLLICILCANGIFKPDLCNKNTRQQLLDEFDISSTGPYNPDLIFAGITGDTLEGIFESAFNKFSKMSITPLNYVEGIQYGVSCDFITGEILIIYDFRMHMYDTKICTYTNAVFDESSTNYTFSFS